MKVYKKMKFPFEVTKGKAEDLYRLRFMRKSELEPLVQHNLRHNVGQMGHQLDLWFKEQLFTIGSLNKEQEKLYQTRKKLKTEIRKAKKREYARHQEEIRTKLKDIKTRMLMMKVVQKFKENVAIARSYRSGENNLKGNVDVLRVSGNKQLIHGSDEKPKSYQGIEKNDEVNKVNDSEENELNKTDEINSKISKKCIRNSSHQSKGDSFRSGIEIYRDKRNPEDYDEDVTDSESDENVDSDDAFGLPDIADSGLRISSSHGPKMETIPEESEEVELEIEDLRSFPKLTKKRLRLLNRSQSKRNVFDVSDSVPLLPEVTESNTKTQASDLGSHHPDMADKETQTSDKSKSDRAKRKKPSHLRRAAKISDGHGKKTIVVKLPRSKIPTPRVGDSAKSRNGVYDSDESDDENSTDFAYGFETDLLTTETDESDESDAGNISSVSQSIPADFSLSLYKTTLRRNDNITSASKSLPSVNFEANFPNVTAFSIQNPFSVRYKERSFVLKTSDTERTTKSAKLHKKSHDLCSEADISPRIGLQDKIKELRKKRSEEIKKLLMQENRVCKQENPYMAIFGKKPEGFHGQHFPSPPTSPEPAHIRQGFSPRRSTTVLHQKKSLFTQSRAKAEEQERIHEAIISEPVQKYERTRSGKIRPFGTPRIISHEIPSLRDQYYRDKLLKAERDSMLKQNIKMKKFIDTFEKGSDKAKLPTVSGSPGIGTETARGDANVDKTKKSLGNFLFKVYQPEQNVELERKVVPGVSTTSLRLLKNCRYLREYRPIEDVDKDDVISEKKTSWDMGKTRADYSNAYLANVRVNLI